MRGFSALVLAGSRGGTDPVAAYAGVAHKALIRVAGATLLARVVAALKDAGAARIAVSTSEPAVAALALTLGAEVIAATDSPSLSVAAAAAALGAPLVVTTCDHALLEGEWISRFLADVPAGIDVAAMVAPEAAVRAAAPQTERSYLAFKDGRVSGCNLFYFATPRAQGVLDLWRQVEAQRKQPWKIAALLGPVVLLGYLTRSLTLDQTVARLGGKAGVMAAAVRTPFGLAAVDVDKPSDLDLVRGLVG